MVDHSESNLNASLCVGTVEISPAVLIDGSDEISFDPERIK